MKAKDPAPFAAATRGKYPSAPLSYRGLPAETEAMAFVQAILAPTTVEGRVAPIDVADGLSIRRWIWISEPYEPARLDGSSVINAPTVSTVQE